MLRSIRVVVAAALLLTSLTIAPFASAEDRSPAEFTPPTVKVAVVRSQTTLDWLNRRGTPGRYPHGGKETAAYNYLKSQGYDVTEIVGDRDLVNLDTLKQYDVIVLPLVFAMGAKASETLARYVADGGGIVSAMSSPRADPAHANRPGTKNDQREWWWRIFKTNDWELGPLSQVYQQRMVNDNWTPKYTVTPNAANQVTVGAQEILESRGYADDVSGMKLLRDPGAGLELLLPIRGSSDASGAATYYVMDSTIRRAHPGTYNAITTARYRAGRSVYFSFSVTDFLVNYNRVLHDKTTSSGVPQGEVAAAMFESAIKWAGTKDDVRGAEKSTVYAYGTVKARSSGMSESLRVKNVGPLITYGTLRVRVYNPKGKLVQSYAKKGVSTQPGTTRSYSASLRKRLTSGQYRVVISYDYGYPLERVSTSSTGYLSRGGKVTTK
jgi:hypothetical protein